MCECPELYEEKEIKRARKEHVCECCSGAIRLGSTYFSMSGKWAGEFTRLAAHPRCLRVYRRLSDEDGDCCGLSFNQTLDALAEWTQNNRYQRARNREQLKAKCAVEK